MGRAKAQPHPAHPPHPPTRVCAGSPDRSKARLTPQVTELDLALKTAQTKEIQLSEELQVPRCGRFSSRKDGRVIVTDLGRMSWPCSFIRKRGLVRSVSLV